MLVKILKPFPYAREGKFTVMLEAGAVEDIDASVVEGLFDEGLIDEATDDDVSAADMGVVVLPPPVEIPDGWEGLHWFKQKKLAETLSGRPVHSKAVAVAVIIAELEKRG